jgi:hypothetical protein
MWPYFTNHTSLIVIKSERKYTFCVVTSTLFYILGYTILSLIFFLNTILYPAVLNGACVSSTSEVFVRLCYFLVVRGLECMAMAMRWHPMALPSYKILRKSTNCFSSYYCVASLFKSILKNTDGNRSSFRNVVFFRIPGDGRSPKSYHSRGNSVLRTAVGGGHAVRLHCPDFLWDLFY